jgi:hypothetical protein
MFGTVITCKAYDLEKAIEARYNLPQHSVEIRSLFFEGDYMNDSYKALYFGDDQVEDYKRECLRTKDDDTMTCILVCMYLRECFPDPAIDTVLVDVSW